ncbi:MAG TPA: HK97 family phage prohead protease [Acidimicrobiia bacterium]
MPYYITDSSADCAGWATLKDDGEVIGCHNSKQAAIDQMVAVSLAEGIEPGGERMNTMTEALEVRSLDTEPLELRAAVSDDSIGTFAGYAIRYDSPSLPLPFTERVARGALTRTLKAKNDIRMYVNHDDRLVLASTRSKTLRLEDREDGLFVEADLPDTSYARDLRAVMEKRVVNTMSFGFSTVRDSWSNDGSERTLDEIRLHEVSVVTGVAAYPATTASVRSWLVPAKRAAVDPEELTVAVAKLHAGETLTDDDVRTITSVVDSLREAPVEADEPIEEDTVADVPATDLSVLRARLSLMERRLGLI